MEISPPLTSFHYVNSFGVELKLILKKTSGISGKNLNCKEFRQMERAKVFCEFGAGREFSIFQKVSISLNDEYRCR